MKRRVILIALICAVAFGFSAHSVQAVQPDEVLDDPALEARARVLSRELRCLVCRNESIDESDATLARDLRLLVRERLVEGDSNEDVQITGSAYTQQGGSVFVLKQVNLGISFNGTTHEITEAVSIVVEHEIKSTDVSFKLVAV